MLSLSVVLLLATYHNKISKKGVQHPSPTCVAKVGIQLALATQVGLTAPQLLGLSLVFLYSN